ncbi:DUF2250 domain-containing protein [Caenorhabditis elegans]|uniref:DUF2250 domain-containing protein n=1 Tax=Caenorhabditis elegans TaxID=6239 RepID=Q9N4Q9_CAEEL|nr:DUF2250 domain-containing protein [Caenorhabditis elegans]CCD67434.1 DUF2250 domain-containing protein [Caenorhabditis elegans]|eukprot:NP_503595.1 Uncharacterized protein CELE_Y5H2B.3 [Caenorhabditis elegans]
MAYFNGKYLKDLMAKILRGEESINSADAVEILHIPLKLALEIGVIDSMEGLDPYGEMKISCKRILKKLERKKKALANQKVTDPAKKEHKEHEQEAKDLIKKEKSEQKKEAKEQVNKEKSEEKKKESVKRKSSEKLEAPSKKAKNSEDQENQVAIKKKVTPPKTKHTALFKKCMAMRAKNFAY